MQLLLLLLFFFVLIILGVLTKMSHDFNAFDPHKEADPEKVPAYKSKLYNGKAFVYAGIVACFLLLIAIIYKWVDGSIYAGHYHEWINIIVRWMHITFGIAWIGASFLFVFMENSLKKDPNRPDLKGNMWMVHGGGFFFVEKYAVAPEKIPHDLHWFKYEAYFTWLTGILLLFLVYYFNAEAMLIDPNVLDMPNYVGILLGVGSLGLGYLIYDLLSRTPLLKTPVYFGIVLFCILVGFAYFYANVFNARAAYIHFGALIGTMMAGNVFFVIIPSQKALVKAAQEGTYLDPWLGQYSSLRSFHNNYFTLPVLFVMISNHFPSTFGHEYNWVILAALSISSGGLKHYLNLKEKGELSTYVLPVSIVMLVSIIFMSAPAEPGECKEDITITEIYSIFQARCVNCHSAAPTDKTYTVAPNGVKYDTPQEIKKMADKIMQRVVLTKTMPQNNITGMLDEERDKVRCWIEQGASIDL